MADALSRKSPAPLAGGKDRANFDFKQVPSTIANSEPEENFAALYVARRYRLPLPMAQAVAALANLGRYFL